MPSRALGVLYTNVMTISGMLSLQVVTVLSKRGSCDSTARRLTLRGWRLSGSATFTAWSRTLGHGRKPVHRAAYPNPKRSSFR